MRWDRSSWAEQEEQCTSTGTRGRVEGVEEWLLCGQKLTLHVVTGSLVSVPSQLHKQGCTCAVANNHPLLLLFGWYNSSSSMVFPF